MRLKGQELEIRILVDGVLQDAFTAQVSFDDSIKTELKEQGYLGEKTNRHDEVYNGTDFNLKMHVESNKWMTFQKLITDRAQRITPGTVVTSASGAPPPCINWLTENPKQELTWHSIFPKSTRPPFPAA